MTWVFTFLLRCPCEMSINIPSGILVTNYSRLEQKDWKNKCKVCPTNHYATLNYIHPILTFCKIQAWGIDFHKYISCHVATLSWLSLPLRHAQFTKQQSCSFITVWVNLYNAFMLSLSTLVSVSLEVVYMLLLAFKLSMVLRVNSPP
jgi:hypothetical protein